MKKAYGTNGDSALADKLRAFEAYCRAVIKHECGASVGKKNLNNVKRIALCEIGQEKYNLGLSHVQYCIGRARNFLAEVRELERSRNAAHFKKHPTFYSLLLTLGVAFLLNSCGNTSGQTPTPAPTYSINLGWNANATGDNVNAYIVYEHTGATYTDVTFTNGSTITTTLANVAAGSHSYVVTATNTVGESGYSNEVTVVVPKPAVAPSTPTNLKATLIKNP